MQRSKFSPSLILILFLFATACAGLKTRDRVQKERGKDRSDIEAEVPETVDSKSESIPNEYQLPPPVQKLPKVGLILGPGGVKALAHTGVIRKLIEAKVPIDFIVGIEWGSLVAGLYAMNGKVHEAEWKIYKLEKKDFPSKGFLSSQLKAKTMKDFNGFLKSNIGNFRTDATRVPFACPSLSFWSGSVVWQNRGNLQTALKKCMPYPPMFQPTDRWVASNFSIKEASDYLRDKGAELIILINVLGRGEIMHKNEAIDNSPSAVLWQEVRRSIHRQKRFVNQTITVNTSKFKLFDFDKRSMIVSAGEAAGAKAGKILTEKYGF